MARPALLQSNISNTVFIANVASAAGGAAEAYTVPDLVVYHCLFSNNTAGGLGPGWAAFASGPQGQPATGMLALGNGTGVLNEGKGYGGGLYAPGSWVLVTGARGSACVKVFEGYRVG